MSNAEKELELKKSNVIEWLVSNLDESQQSEVGELIKEYADALVIFTSEYVINKITKPKTN